MFGINHILDRHGELKAARQPAETQWRDIAKLMRPEQEDMFSGNSKTSAYDDIYDSTQLYALESFSGGIFGQLTNPANRWFELSLQDKDLAKWLPVKHWLYSVANVIYASISPSVSNFYSEAPAWFADLGAFGMGTLYQEEVPGKGRILDRVMPLGETYIDIDMDGDIDTVHREFKLKGVKAKREFPDLAEPASGCQDKSEYTFIHAVSLNPEFEAGRLGPRGMPWVSAYVSPDLRNFMRLGGYYQLPYHAVMWNRRPGRVYPVGPGHMARPDVAMLQEMERSHIVAAQHAAEPALLLPDESTITAADVVPNAVLYGAVSEDGRELARPLNRAQNLGLSREQSQQRRDAIREAFFFGLMQLMNRPQMTATEFLGFQEEKLRLMGPNLARIQGQGLSPFLSRRYRMLERAGQLPPPPPELEGHAIEVEYVSPLAKMQQAATGRAVLSWIGAVGQVAQTTGDSGVLDNIDGDAVVSVLHDAFGPPPAVRRDPREVEKIRKQRAALAAQQTELDQQEQSVAIQSEAAHAAQAQTLAADRVQP
ncbi:portal protein [Chelatococcus asaccharovorans]|uniref:Head-to-tail connecting protein n=1 Tax=Chelatococcus asaccharovorans TaxID=28210 RepID=A0A2V3UBE5_9HYPH|nr:portal protein [Chelatococcus asaccharovorans]MBS7703182.1 hypothetical protein [Chelatococcus asaccharovorans]PXW61511.1 head-to-tail connecting protein [Chelatococcus asaccharovorans]